MAQKRIIYKLTNERIPAVSGIGLVGNNLHNSGFPERFQTVRLSEKRSRKQIDMFPPFRQKCASGFLSA